MSGSRDHETTSTPRSDAAAQIASAIAVRTKQIDAESYAAMEARLRLVESRYNALASAGAYILWSTNAEGFAEEEVPAWCSYTGQSPEEMRGLGWLDALHPDDREAARRSWLRALAAKGPYSGELRIRGADGLYRTFLVGAVPVLDEGGAVREFVGYCTDISAYKRAEQERVEQAGQLEAMLESIADAVVVYDASTRIIRANTAMRRLFALDADPDYYIRTPEERIALLNMRDAAGDSVAPENFSVYRVLRGEVLVGPTTVDVRCRALDGREVLVNVSGAPIRSPAGAIIGAIQLMRDVTEQQRLEDERSHILGVVSHELKTPLTALKARAQLLHRRLPRLASSDSELLGKIAHDIARIERLVNDLLDASRLETGQLELDMDRCELVHLCQQVIDDQIAATGRMVAFEPPAGPIEVEADAVRIEQVLANLLSNALKYSPNDSPVTVTLHREGASARVAVRDSGPGIAPEAQAHLFERFYRAPGATVQSGTGVGLGLGLYLCRALVERHSGHIGVESTPGKGATFAFTLPLAK